MCSFPFIQIEMYVSIMQLCFYKYSSSDFSFSAHIEHFSPRNLHFSFSQVSIGKHPQLCCPRQQNRTPGLPDAVRLACVFIHRHTADSDHQPQP